MTKGGVTYVSGHVGDGAGSDASLMKLVYGVPAWPAPKTYDSPYHSLDIATCIALGPGNAVYTAGMSIGANGMFDMLLLKWSAAGGVQWARRYDGPAHGQDQATEVVVDSAGNVTVCGSTTSGAERGLGRGELVGHRRQALVVAVRRRRTARDRPQRPGGRRGPQRLRQRVLAGRHRARAP